MAFNYNGNKIDENLTINESNITKNETLYIWVNYTFQDSTFLAQSTVDKRIVRK